MSVDYEVELDSCSPLEEKVEEPKGRPGGRHLMPRLKRSLNEQPGSSLSASDGPIKERNLLMCCCVCSREASRKVVIKSQLQSNSIMAPYTSASCQGFHGNTFCLTYISVIKSVRLMSSWFCSSSAAAFFSSLPASELWKLQCWNQIEASSTPKKIGGQMWKIRHEAQLLWSPAGGGQVIGGSVQKVGPPPE